MRFKKYYGQVFLRDRNYLRKMAQSLPVENETVLEIGSGSGQLTKYLYSCVNQLYCIEKDAYLVEVLKKKFSQENVHIIKRDILKLPLKDMGTSLVIVGNIPFNISNYLVRYLILQRNYIKACFLLFQKEFAQRLVALPNTKRYCYLTCYLNYYAEPKLILHIPRRAFYPIPKVDASLVEIKFKSKPPLDDKNTALLFQLIKRAFNFRRKKILNALGGLTDTSILKSALDKSGIDFNLRPDAISLSQYIQLYQNLKDAKLE